MDLSKGCLSYLGSLEVAKTNDFYVALGLGFTVFRPMIALASQGPYATRVWPSSFTLHWKSSKCFFGQVLAKQCCKWCGKQALHNLVPDRQGLCEYFIYFYFDRWVFSFWSFWHVQDINNKRGLLRPPKASWVVVWFFDGKIRYWGKKKHYSFSISCEYKYVIYF